MKVRVSIATAASGSLTGSRGGDLIRCPQTMAPSPIFDRWPHYPPPAIIPYRDGSNQQVFDREEVTVKCHALARVFLEAVPPPSNPRSFHLGANRSLEPWAHTSHRMVDRYSSPSPVSKYPPQHPPQHHSLDTLLLNHACRCSSNRSAGICATPTPRPIANACSLSSLWARCHCLVGGSGTVGLGGQLGGRSGLGPSPRPTATANPTIG
jgi:hypothetical protein